MTDMQRTWGWKSDFETFRAASPRVVRIELADFVKDASDSQIRAWDHSIPVLQVEAAETIRADSAARTYSAILEYQLPLESRRPDVVILENGVVVIMELKGKEYPNQSDLDQVAAYARDLRSYHRECSDRPVYPVLVPMRNHNIHETVDGTHVVAPSKLAAVMADFSRMGSTPLSIDAFLASDAYAPLPTLVQAARELFNSKEIRKIWQAGACTDPAVELCGKIALEAAATKTRHLILLMGVPGSGKTLVGLRLVHADFLDRIAIDRGKGKYDAPAIFLSGNGPLVEVLQYELRNAGGGGKAFVRGVKEYVASYAKRPTAIPPQHVLVFDEAQRAWDAAYVKLKHQNSGESIDEKSEPEHFIEFAERIPEWCVVVGLIGGGQEIHVGEEGGTEQWPSAILNAKDPSRWIIHAPPEIVNTINGKKCRVEWHHELNLNTEIRFHLAKDIHRFVGLVLGGKDSGEASKLADLLHAGGIRFLITRDIEIARRYAHERYAECREARYGLLASSRDKVLCRYGINNDFQSTKRVRVGPWFADGHESGLSCRNLIQPITEFQVQGLELDLAILCWGTDLVREESGWSIKESRGFKKGLPVKNPYQLRINSYRVLLTRGRDGTVVFVPPLEQMDRTHEHLRSCGFRLLSR